MIPTRRTLRRRSSAPALVSAAFLVLPAFIPGPARAQEPSAAELARADSMRAELARVRPANDYGTDVIDVVTVPIKIVVLPFRLIFVTLPSVAIGQITVPRPPGFITRTYDDLSDAGVHPGFHTAIGPRSGPAVSLNVDRFGPLEIEGAYSIRGSQRYQLGSQFDGEDFSASAGTSWRRDAQVGFYGIGPESPDRELLYRRDQFRLGASASQQFGLATVDAQLGFEDNLIGRPDVGSAPTLFDEPATEALFGASQRLRYAIVGVGVGLDLTHKVEFQDRGVRLFARATGYRGTSGTPSNFHKLRFEAHGLLPLNRRQLLALKGRTDFTRGGSNEVPFYHLAQLGGEETALGYRDNRFADRDMVSLSSEWRYEIWRDIHNEMRVQTFLYFGEGTVAEQLDEIVPSDWKASYAAGFRVERSSGLLGLAFVGFSAERVVVNISGEWTP